MSRAASLRTTSHRGRILLQIPHQIIDIRQMLAQHTLLALDAQRRRRRVARLLSAQLAGALRAVAAASGSRRLGHEVEVQELHRLELDVAGGGARLEDGRHGEQAVELLKGAGVAGRLEEGGDEHEEGGGLDGGAVDGFEEVEEELCEEGAVSHGVCRLE